MEVQDIDELAAEEQEEVEAQLEGETEAVDLYELQLEIDQLANLIDKINNVRQMDVERKYIELEKLYSDLMAY